MSVTAFLTDSTLCIGCKACEVACKEWNGVADDGLTWSGFSYDNTGALGHSTWRHVKFVDGGKLNADGAEHGEIRGNVFSQRRHGGAEETHSEQNFVTSWFGGDGSSAPVAGFGGNAPEFATWTFSSDVCKHCENAGCLEACPTGAIVRTEFGGVFVQPDVCNGCAYCVVACPFGVVQKNKDDGRAFKCTFCYDRQKVGLEPACAKACPTESIKFGELSELQLDAQERVEELQGRGMRDAALYDASETSVGGTHALFIVRGDPRTYNLPPRPEVPTIYNEAGWRASAVGGLAMLAAGVLAFLAGRE